MISQLFDRVADLESKFIINNESKTTSQNISSTFEDLKKKLCVVDGDDDGLTINNNNCSKNYNLYDGNLTVPPILPPLPVTENFKFTSTPNTIFLSRGKLHPKVSFNKNGRNNKMLELSENGIEHQRDDEKYLKSKKQR